MFYRATVQAVLLFGSETWNLASSAMKLLEGFHVRDARRMAGWLPTRHENGRDWVYPSSADVLKKVGLRTIAEYMEVRRSTIAVFIAHSPIFGMCKGGVRRRGTNPHHF